MDEVRGEIRAGGQCRRGSGMAVEHWQLLQRQSHSLPVKIQMSKGRIREWHEHWDGEVYVAFSGGLDSTVLLHLVRSIYPDTLAVFHNTGLEYPEIVSFVKTKDNVEWTRPKIHFKEVIQKYGYPVVSKRIAQYIGDVQRARGETATKRLRLTGIKTDGTKSPMSMISKKWQYLCDAPFKVSDRCCNVMKKNPAREVEKRGLYPFLGTRVEESQQREQMYYMHGCNAFDLSHPRSTPIAFWMDQDIRDYIKEFDLPYSKIYDMGYTRTGCMWCMFGVHLEKEPNRFQRMMKTHPKLYTYCMEKLGLAEVLDYIHVPYGEPAQGRLF